VDELLRDKTPPPGAAPVAPSCVEEVVAMTLNRRLMKQPIELSTYIWNCPHGDTKNSPRH
jgi:hypothetical protein